MSGLFCKDYYTIRGSILLYVFMSLCGAASTLLIKRETFIILITTLFSTLLLANVLTAETHSGWNKMALSMPVARGTLVREKFILLLLLTIAGEVFGCLLSVPFLINGRVKAGSLLSMGLLGGSMALLSGAFSVMLTCMHIRSMIEKEEVLMMITYLIGIGVCMALFWLLIRGTKSFLPSFAGSKFLGMAVAGAELILILLACLGIERVSEKKFARLAVR